MGKDYGTIKNTAAKHGILRVFMPLVGLSRLKRAKFARLLASRRDVCNCALPLNCFWSESWSSSAPM